MTSTRAVIGMILCRIIVPLWVLAGATFKLYERTPSNLPSGILKVAKDSGVDLDTLLRTLIGLEFFAVGVMVFIPRFARAMAIFMLSSFCGILIWELIRSATKCGCFGSITIKPWQMLLIDGFLLLSVIFFNLKWVNPPADSQPQRRSLTPALVTAVVLLVLGLGVSFAVPNPPGKDQKVINDYPGPDPLLPDGSSERTTSQTANPPTPSDPTINPNPAPIPNSWYTRDMDKWVGQPWRNLEIFQLMPRWPKDMDSGKHYIIFYSRTCEHCEEMFRYDLIVPLDGPVTAVEIPFSKTEMRPADAWTMPQTAPIEHMELPMGCNWIVQTPLVIAVQDGKVICANEGDHKPCMGLQ